MSRKMSGRGLRKAPIKTAIIITVLVFAVMLTVLFALSGGLFEVFDKLLGMNMQDAPIYSGEVAVNLSVEGDSYEYLKLDNAAQKIIEDYFLLYYGVLGELNFFEASRNNLSTLYTRDSAAFKRDTEALEKLIETRANAPVNMTYGECFITLNYLKSHFADNMVEVTVEESFYARFDGLPDWDGGDVKTRHFFDLKKVAGKWLILDRDVLS